MAISTLVLYQKKSSTAIKYVFFINFSVITFFDCLRQSLYLPDRCVIEVELKKDGVDEKMPELKWARDKKVEEIEDEIDEREIVRLDKWSKKVEDKPIERVSSGVPGLDLFMEGGFPKGFNIIVKGKPGTAKTTFAMHFIAEGCKKNEKCLYMTAEQSPVSIITQALRYHMPYPKWEEQGNLQFAYLNWKKNPSARMFNYVLQTIEDNHYDRFVIDSLSALMDASFPIAYNKILELFEKTTEYGVSTVCIIRENDKGALNEIIHYVGDGLIDLEASPVGETENRTIQIEKIRWTKTNILQHPFEYTENGITLI